ncbi:ABC transporter substrate-binding protein [Psychromicrobium lacuslunae]|uniref:ABC transporter substrate-binding protein n=1 Tax=Psychromicrobium lacuslunae TaxID=1618207 RepID=UPI0005D3E1B8|nr:ABC transporter substrate-binding protein [Psychromicrobium lacuslunae]
MKKITTRRLTAGVLATALALVPAAVIAPAATAEDSSGSTLKLALIGDIDSLNPFISITAQGTNILVLQYQNLVSWGTNNEPVPGLADKWTTSSDGKEWTFHMPADRKWSDGEPITANDAVWTFNAIKGNEKLKQANGALVENVKSIVAKDPENLVLTLNTVQAPNPGGDLPIMPEHIWSKQADPTTYANDKDTVGSGPFIISSYDKAAGVTMKANPNYWKGKAKVDRIIWAPYQNSDAAVQALKNGEIDIAGGLTPAQFQSLKGQPNITTNAGQGRRYTALGINPGTKSKTGKVLGDGNPALQDVNLRKAIVMAIDNKTLLEKVLQGLGDEATGEIPAAYPLYHWDSKDLPLKFNPEAANKLLDESGYTKGADGIRLDKSGKPLNLRLLGRNTDPTHQQMADYLKPWLKNIGINVTTTMKSSGQVNEDSSKGNFDLYFTGWGIGPDPDYQLSINQCSSLPDDNGTGNTTENALCDPKFDALYKQQHAELDQAKRSELVKQAQEIIYNSAVNDVIWYANALEAYRSDRFQPFTTQPEKGGVITGQNGPWGYYSATPIGASSTTDGGFNWAWVVIPVIVVVLAALAFFLLRRRSASADNRE